jgi:hypothetical protein
LQVYARCAKTGPALEVPGVCFRRAERHSQDSYAPPRLKKRTMTVEKCPFCDVPSGRIFYEGELTLGIWDGFPVSPGHALVITRRHVPSWFEATPQERIEIVRAIDDVRALISAKHQPMLARI